MKIFKIVAVIVVIAALGAGVAYWLKPKQDDRDYDTQAARVKTISSMVELCTADIHDEMPIKDSINGKWIVARQVLEGRIRFDLDALRIEERGDTTVVYLPPERVDVLENAGPDAYEVLDAWDGRNMIFSRTLTAAEENALKKRWQRQLVGKIYDKGYVRQARANAVKTLAPLLSAMRGSTSGQGAVIVIDPTPEGVR